MVFQNGDLAPIPIIAFGEDSSSANSIMNYMGNFAQRYMICNFFLLNASNSFCICSFIAPTDHFFNVAIDSEKLVEVGPVFLAKNGVCYLGDWSTLSKKHSDEIKIREHLNLFHASFKLLNVNTFQWLILVDSFSIKLRRIFNLVRHCGLTGVQRKKIKISQMLQCS